MSVKIQDNDDLWNAIEKDLRKLNKSHVNVGFMGGDVREDSPLTNAEVAVFNEFGTANAPARPFMRPAIAKNKNSIMKMQEEGYSDVLKQRSSVGRELKSIGVFVTGEIQREITSVKSPANAKSTIKAKGSSNPLIDTGAMRQSVTHKVEL